MRRCTVVIGVAIASVSAAAWVAPYTYRYEMTTCPGGANPGMCIGPQSCVAGTCAGSAPTDPNEGMLLQGVSSYRVTACAASGQTLSGAGSLQTYRYDGAEGLWVRDPGLDLTVTASGQRCQTFPDYLIVGSQTGRVRFVASAVTVSGGAGLDVLVEGYGVLR